MRGLKAAALGAAFAVAVVAATITSAGAAPQSYVPVTSADLIAPPATPAAGQFSLINDGDGSGGVTTVNGPGSARGSLQLTVTGPSSHWQVLNEDHNSTPLSGISTLTYSTYTNDAGATLDPVLQLVIDPGNTTGLDAGVTFSTLNFEPYLQGPSNPVVPNTWQSWDVRNGVVWGTHLTGAPNAAPISWSQFLSDYPNATVTGGVGIGVGSSWGPMVGNVSTLAFGTGAGTTTYLFEPVAYLQITSPSVLPPAQVGASYSTSLAAIGGNPPYKWKVESGHLPMGLHLNKTSGAITGVPSRHDSGTYSFDVTVVDTKVKVKHQPPSQNSASQSFSIAIS